MRRCLLALGALALGAEAFLLSPSAPQPLSTRSYAPSRCRVERLGLRMQSAEASPKTKAQVLDAISKPWQKASEDGAEQVFKTFEGFKEAGTLSKWNSAEFRLRNVNQNELKRALKTDKELDDLLGLTGVPVDLKQLTIGAFALSAIFGVGGSAIGGETGGLVYWITYLGGGIPLLLLGVGSVAPGAIGAGLSKLQWQFDETNTKERRIRHEAAHLLCGYLCGLPIEAYELEPTPACKFYDRTEGNIDDIEAWKKPRPFDADEINKLSIVSMSGLMGELTAYDNADGGQGDLEQLEDFFFRADGERLRKPTERESQTRWGALIALELLEKNKAAYEALCKAMDQNLSIEECVATIESA